MKDLLTFAACRKENRDRKGIWKMQAGLSVITWLLLLLHLALTIGQFILPCAA